MKSLITSLIFSLMLFAGLCYADRPKERCCGIVYEFKRMHALKLKPEVKYGGTFREQVDNIKYYAKEKVRKNRKQKYWLEIVYAENASYETACMLAAIKADDKMATHTTDFIVDSKEYEAHGSSYINSVKRSKKVIAGLVKYKRKMYTICVVYAYELSWS